MLSGQDADIIREALKPIVHFLGIITILLAINLWTRNSS
jgi:hypothetical protein